MANQAQPPSTVEPSHPPSSPKTGPNTTRRVILISGGLVLFFGLYLLIFLVPDVVQNMQGPDDLTLAEAAGTATDDQNYARITDGVWNCDTIAYVRGPSSSNRLKIVTRSTEAFLTDANNPEQIVVFATFSGEKSCDDIEGSELSGYLKRMSSDKRQELTSEARLARYFDAKDYLEMCAYCGPSNSLIGTIFGIVISVSGIALLAWGWRMPSVRVLDDE